MHCYACDRFVAKPTIIEHRPYCESCAGHVSHSGHMRDSGTLPAPEPKSSVSQECHVSEPENVTLTNCSEVIRDYFGAAAAVDSDDYRPVPHDAEVRARIDEVIREYEPDDWCDSVPLAEQIAQYGDRCEAVLDALHTNLEDEWFRTAVIRLGVERLTEGHEKFGSKMYSWDANKLDDEMLEEIADYVVYGTSGSFFNLRSAR